MKTVSIKGALSLLLLALVFGGSRAAVSQTRAGSSTENLPSFIARAVETIRFSFVYDKRPSSELLPHWEQKQVRQILPGNRERRVVTYRGRRTGLEVIDEITVYKSLHAVDWALRLQNTGAADTPIIEKLRPGLRFGAAPRYRGMSPLAPH